MQILPSYDSQFITLFESNNGCVRRHVAVDTNGIDYSDVKTISYEKAIAGMKVDMMPILLSNDPLCDVIFPDAKDNKSPDLRINGVLWEVEKSFNSLKINNLKHAVDEGSKQADYVIIIVSHDINIDFMFRIIKGRFKEHKLLKRVEFRYEGNYTVFNK